MKKLMNRFFKNRTFLKSAVCAHTLCAAVLACALMAGCFAPGAQAASDKPLAGKYISFMGDSISTYTGWSDKYPITGESCTNRYGEAYYGPEGGDFHNTDLLVTDTWWHQAATQLGADILMSNAGNSTGLLHASYPANEAWDLYLKEMLAYKDRPYYLGRDGKNPDIIALYIGSNDVAKVSKDDFGSVEAVDFSTLITANSGGGYNYAAPTTVAEAYCILLHKISVAYPNAEVYCFTVVPNSGGYLSTVNTRLAATHPYNEMIRGVASHFGAIVVELLEAFELDPDMDGTATQADFEEFQSCFNGDPHPNAKGFDIITECFVDTVLENSKYLVRVESTAGNHENVGVDVTESASAGNSYTNKNADNFVTENKMIVDYDGESTHFANSEFSASEHYTSTNESRTYRAEGGSETALRNAAPGLNIEFPLTVKEGSNIGSAENENESEKPDNFGTPDTGDGVYDYGQSITTGKGSLRVSTNECTITAPAAGLSDLKHVFNPTFPDETNDLVSYASADEPFVLPETADDIPEIPEGYDYVYIGSDQYSNFWAARAFKSKSSSYPKETPFYSDEDISLYVRRSSGLFVQRGLVLDELYLPGKPIDKDDTQVFPAYFDSVQQFVLADKNAKLATTYCAEQGNPATEGYAYRIYNLEDADYYTEENAGKIRSVAYNGYWGTESGFGSLDAMKDMMRDSEKFTEEEIASLTDSMAMTATQYSIWNFSNAMNDVVFTSVYFHNPDGLPRPSQSAEEEAQAALVMKLHHYLIGLEPTVIKEAEKHTGNTIINEKNFIDSIVLKVHDKPRNHPDNQDSDPGNDVYTADFSFDFAVDPNPNSSKDSLVLEIVNADTGSTTTCRIAGELQEGEVQLVPDGDRYTVSGLTLQEGTESLTFRLKGVQDLEKNVYLYKSEIKDGVPSQTLVGVAEGPRSVNAKMGLQFDMNVVDRTYYYHRVWRTENNIFIPETGDETDLFMLCAALSLSLMMMYILIRRGRKPDRTR